MSKKIIASLFMLSFLAVSFTTLAQQEGNEKHDHAGKPRATASASDIIVLPNEAVIIVHGIVCSFCSQGVIRKVSRLSFVDKSRYKKGVKVEIENQKVTIAIKPDKKLDLRQVFNSIRAGGYEPVEAYISDGKNGTLHKKAEDVES